MFPVGKFRIVIDPRLIGGGEDGGGGGGYYRESGLDSILSTIADSASKIIAATRRTGSGSIPAYNPAPQQPASGLVLVLLGAVVIGVAWYAFSKKK